jgi:hypothetical protein
MCLQGWRRRGRGEEEPKEMMRLCEKMGSGKGCDLWRRRYLGRRCVPSNGLWLGEGGPMEVMGLKQDVP